jgi:hypothetical protein
VRIELWQCGSIRDFVFVEVSNCVGSSRPGLETTKISVLQDGQE